MGSSRLHPTVWRLGWISFFADVASEIAYPLVPLFLRDTLRASVRDIGLIEGAAEATVSLMKGWSGLRSDRTGRRVPYVQWGYGLSAVGKPLIGLAMSWPMVMGARVADRFGKGLRTTARDALIVDVTDSRMLGRAFGFHRGLDTAGALVGVLLAAALIALLPGQYRLIFLLAAIPGLISWLLTLRLRDTAPPTTGEVKVRKRPELTRAYWGVVALSLIFGLGNSSDALLLLRARELGLSELGVVLHYALYNVTYMLASYPAGVMSDRMGRWGVMAIGWSLYAALYLGFGWGSAGWLVPLFLGYGLTIGLTKGVQAALVADHAPSDGRGTALGMFHMAAGLATLAANAVAGTLWEAKGPGWAFSFGAACAALAVLAIPVVRRLSV